MSDCKIDIRADHITIADAKGDEIVYWDRQEWLDDPDLTIPISNAILLACMEGAEAVRAKLKR
jgi:hypothetical protein